MECEECGKVTQLCPMCDDKCTTCCLYGLCSQCSGHLEGDPDDTGICCDCRPDSEEKEEEWRMDPQDVFEAVPQMFIPYPPPVEE